MLMGWGDLEAALDACDAARTRLRDDPHPLPATLRGAILVAAGHLERALAELRVVTRQFSEYSLAHLYFAEACLLSGRADQASRALDAARNCDDGRHAAFLNRLHELRTMLADERPTTRIDLD
jgi:predicted Zn-dependent protease